MKIVLKKYTKDCTQKLCDELMRKKIVRKIFSDKNNIIQLVLKYYPPQLYRKSCAKKLFSKDLLRKNYT